MGTPFLETLYTKIPIKGSVHTNTRVSTGSRVRVMSIPPIRRIGARMPMRCIMPSIWCTLYVSVVSLASKDGMP